MEKRLLAVVLLIAVMITGCTRQERKHLVPEDEVFYHVFLRSFYDSNGDGHGDLNGLRMKLDYLQDLGVTTVLITPLYHSPFYHNYFAEDFYRIDPEYGTEADLLALIDDMHRRRMKLIMDMEIHYVTNLHEWFRDSYGNPSSPYSRYIIYNDSANTDPEPIIWDLDTVDGWGVKQVSLWSLDLYTKEMADYMHGLFRHWVDPDGDGDPGDGIDGFRIDHMMDNMDWKNIRTGLLQRFWKPLFAELRALNPRLIIAGEQAEWNYGEIYLGEGLADLVFAIPLCAAINTFDRNTIRAVADTTCSFMKPGKSALVFIENHDMDRFAGTMNSDPAKLRAGAALNILLKGVPLIYYGQELGMKGRKDTSIPHDAGDIPRREAFEWYRTIEGPGMALWYHDGGPWWKNTNLKDNDGISVEEQADMYSLRTYYKNLIALRKVNDAIRSGSQHFLNNDRKEMLTFIRENQHQKVLILINLGNETGAVTVDLKDDDDAAGVIDAQLLFGQDHPYPPLFGENRAHLTAAPYDVQVWRLY